MNQKYKVTITAIPYSGGGMLEDARVMRNARVATGLGADDALGLIKLMAERLPYVLFDGVSLEKAESAMRELAKIEAVAEIEESQCPNPMMAMPIADTVFVSDFWWGIRKQR